MRVVAVFMFGLRELKGMVACPFCMQMFESGVGSLPGAAERGVQVFDLAELFEQSVAYGKPVAASGGDQV